MSQTLSPNEPVRGRWIPWVFVIGFAVVVGVNATLIGFASSSFSGLVVSHPYKKGQEYAATMARLAEQAALGWQVSARMETSLGQKVRIFVTFADRAGAPIERVGLDARLERPVENLPPVELVFIEQAPGSYMAEVTLPKRGIWDLRLLGRKDAQEYEFAERLRAP